MKKRKVTVNIRTDVAKETIEFLMNLESYFTIKPELTKPLICYNAESPLCNKCEEPECLLAEGWKK